MRELERLDSDRCTRGVELWTDPLHGIRVQEIPARNRLAHGVEEQDRDIPSRDLVRRDLHAPLEEVVRRGDAAFERDVADLDWPGQAVGERVVAALLIFENLHLHL